MATDLRTVANSRFISAARLTRPKNSLPKLYVYVEDDIDKLFWRIFLNEKNTCCSVVVSVYKVAGKEIRGKDAIMKAVNEGKLELGENMIVCIDADLDLIIDNYHKYTDVLRKNPYVITTQWYSIENIKCSASNILQILYRLTLEDEIVIDVEEKLSKVYNKISILFLIVLVSIDLKDLHYTLDDFGSVLQKVKFDARGEMNNQSIHDIDDAISNQSEYIKLHEKDIQNMKNKLNDIGYPESRYQCLMRGHDIADFVVTSFVQEVSYSMRCVKLAAIGGSNVNPEHKIQLQQQFANQTGVCDCCGLKHRIMQLLQDCDNFVDSPVFSIINDKIRRALVYGKITSIVEALK